MANIKTIALSGAETAVYISGQNCDIRNDSTDVVYASTTSGVTAGADGVMSIPAGGTVKLLDSNGAVHLLGTGSVMLCGNDYAEPVFKSAASASGGGGTEDAVARTAINTHAANTEIHLTADDAVEAIATTISNPNLLINPDFRINQRGQASYNTNFAYTTDCWKLWKYNAATAGTVTVTDSGVLLESSGEGGSVQLSQAIENSAQLSGRIVTLSVEVADVTGVWSLYQHGNSNPSYKINTAGIHAFSFRWEEVVSPYGVVFSQLATSAEASCKIKWIKLELGSVATPFIPPDPTTELAKCQRYYQIRTTGDINAIDLRPSMMNSTPTITQLDNGNYSYSAEL